MLQIISGQHAFDWLIAVLGYGTRRLPVGRAHASLGQQQSILYMIRQNMHNDLVALHDNFILLRPYHGEHRPKVQVTAEYIHGNLQRVLQKRECMPDHARCAMPLR
jgi:hypothetical protein